MKKVLIVDNDLSIAEDEKAILEISRYVVEIESEGKKARRQALSGEYDMLILEVEFPGWDGLEVCQKYREKYQCPVLFVTKTEEEKMQVRGFGVGADDYIVKPVPSVVLMARVEARMKRYEILTGEDPSSLYEKKPGVIQVMEDWWIDGENCCVFVRGVKKTLTRKECELLSFLAKHPGKFFKTEELYKEVWDHAVTEGSNTVQMHIYKLRDQIGKESEDLPYIKTVKNLGYSFQIPDK